MLAGLWCTGTRILRRPELLRGLPSLTTTWQPGCGFGPCDSAMTQQNNILTPHHLLFQRRKEVRVYLENNRNAMQHFVW